jgi:hypothetical protein
MPTSNDREGKPSMPLVKVYLDKGSKNEQRACPTESKTLREMKGASHSKKFS